MSLELLPRRTVAKRLCGSANSIDPSRSFRVGVYDYTVWPVSSVDIYASLA
jgi:hypothetical protein